MFRFELGEVLRDVVSGFEGVVMVRSEYFTGCVHYGLCPQKLKDEKMIDWEWIDESRLARVVGKRIIFNVQKKTSGAMPAGPQC